MRADCWWWPGVAATRARRADRRTRHRRARGRRVSWRAGRRGCRRRRRRRRVHRVDGRAWLRPARTHAAAGAGAGATSCAAGAVDAGVPRPCRPIRRSAQAIAAVRRSTPRSHRSSIAGWSPTLIHLAHAKVRFAPAASRVTAPDLRSPGTSHRMMPMPDQRTPRCCPIVMTIVDGEAALVRALEALRAPDGSARRSRSSCRSTTRSPTWRTSRHGFPRCASCRWASLSPAGRDTRCLRAARDLRSPSRRRVARRHRHVSSACSRTAACRAPTGRARWWTCMRRRRAPPSAVRSPTVRPGACAGRCSSATSGGSSRRSSRTTPST